MHSPQIVDQAGAEALELVANVLPVQRPAEIVNYKSMGTMPAVLAGGVAAGTVAALGLTLVASVRRRRRDLALLKTLGFTRGQLAAAVAWQSTVVAVVGLVVGVPLGIAAGRWLWLAFARELSAVPDPVVPAASIALAAVAALVLANLVAAVPGRQAARTPAALTAAGGVMADAARGQRDRADRGRAAGDGMARGLVPVPGHVPPPVGRLPGAGRAGRAGRRGGAWRR